jgi:MerR family transcriptional regulator, mercuric resistance operon regulatory protein
MHGRIRDHGDGLRMGELSRLTRVGLETIRYYERIGLLTCPPRAKNGHRVYDGIDVRTLVFIRRARELGFTLAETRALLALRGSRDASCIKAQELAARHLRRVRIKLAALRRAESFLERTLDQCLDARGPDCPLIDLLDGTDDCSASEGVNVAQDAARILG